MNPLVKSIAGIIIQLAFVVFLGYRAITHKNKYAPDVYKMLCGDGEGSYTALQNVYKALEEEPRILLQAIRDIEKYKPASIEEKECRENIRESYKAPAMINATLTAIGTDWDYGVPPGNIKRILRQEREFFSRNINMLYFFDQLLSRY